MTDQLTEVLVRHGIYRHSAIIWIAIDDFTLQDMTGTHTVEVDPREAYLMEAPGNPDWVDRMVRTRKSLVNINKNLQNDNEKMTSWRQGLDEALLEKVEEHNLCEEYDAFAEEWGLTPRNKEFEVVMTVRVKARDEDFAVELVKGHVTIDRWSTQGIDDEPEFSASEA